MSIMVAKYSSIITDSPKENVSVAPTTNEAAKIMERNADSANAVAAINAKASNLRLMEQLHLLKENLLNLLSTSSKPSLRFWSPAQGSYVSFN